MKKIFDVGGGNVFVVLYIKLKLGEFDFKIVSLSQLKRRTRCQITIQVRPQVK